jgi:GNAT superfamily N-acetyltransferase
MLEFREIDYSKDIPEIVDLLRTSLSEKHTKESFKWKHIDNPFGKSLGFLALDKNKIIGVRMFMKWDFSNEGEIIHALRPVDTVTHPDYRNKGIFKKLTLDGLEKYKNNYDLIFNTPNQNSYPGNLKMGWKEYPIKINFKFALILPLFTKSHTGNSPENSNKNKIINSYYTTSKSLDYLQWRYLSDDYKSSEFINGEYSVKIIYTIQKLKGVKIIIIEELIGSEPYFKNAIRNLCSELKIYLIYYLDNHYMKSNFILSLNRKEDVILFRDDKMKNINKIIFSIGDIEGRI